MITAPPTGLDNSKSLESLTKTLVVPLEDIRRRNPISATLSINLRCYFIVLSIANNYENNLKICQPRFTKTFRYYSPVAMLIIVLRTFSSLYLFFA